MTTSTSPTTGHANQSSTNTSAKPKRRRPKKLHSFTAEDCDMADALGIEIKALCGRWVRVTRDVTGAKSSDALRPGQQLCASCDRVAAARGLGWATS